MAEKLIYEPESYSIKGACMEVYKVMGNGFLEAVYQECLEIELAKCGIPFEAQKKLTLMCDGRVLKQKYVPDFICYDKIVLEIKAVSRITPEHRAQVMNCLKATGYQLGLLANFGHYPLLEWVRLPNIKDYKSGEKERVQAEMRKRTLIDWDSVCISDGGDEER
jgi:GxxExxY protein